MWQTRRREGLSEGLLQELVTTTLPEIGMNSKHVFFFFLNKEDSRVCSVRTLFI